MILPTTLRAPHAMAGHAGSATGASGPHCPLTRSGVPQQQPAPTWEELLGQR